jgi:hypothetical protein
MMDANRDFEEVWTRRLAKESEDLNFDDEDDRAIFRGKIFEATRNASWIALRRIATFLGATDIPRSRDRTVRLIVKRWIERGRQHATKKSSAQLQREINEALARTPSAGTRSGSRSHATGGSAKSRALAMSPTLIVEKYRPFARSRSWKWWIHLPGSVSTIGEGSTEAKAWQAAVDFLSAQRGNGA